MHEMSLAERIVEIITEQAQQQPFTRVLRVRLEIGTLAAVEPEALRFGFTVVSRDTVAEAATLEIVERPAQGWCFTCSVAVTIVRRGDPCPHCGGWQLQISGGDEMRIYDLEVV